MEWGKQLLPIPRMPLTAQQPWLASSTCGQRQRGHVQLLPSLLGPPCSPPTVPSSTAHNLLSYFPIVGPLEKVQFPLL